MERERKGASARFRLGESRKASSLRSAAVPATAIAGTAAIGYMMLQNHQRRLDFFEPRQFRGLERREDILKQL